MKERFRNVPGYHEETLGEKLSGQHLIHTFDPDISNIVASKASASEVVRLQEEKTNKSDTESVIRHMEALHTMLKNVIMLVTELSRLGVNHKMESEVVKSASFRNIFDNATIMQRWIESFNISDLGKLPPVMTVKLQP